jgi:two-component system, NarL family, response regulator DesR
MTIRSVIQERRRLYRDGIALALDREPDLHVAGVAVGANELMELCRDERPDVVLTEVDVNEWDPCRLGASLQRLYGPLRLVGLYRSLGGVQARDLRRVGFGSLVSTLTDLRVLREAVRGVRYVEDAPVATRSPYSPPESRLTARQLDVLRLVGQGSTTQEVGRQLGISPKTVAHHKQCVFRKLGVQNQAHAVSIAMRSGLLGADLMASHTSVG